MSILNELASALNRRDEEPNLQLARRLVETENAEDIQELVDNLKNKNKAPDAINRARITKNLSSSSTFLLVIVLI